MPSGSRYWPIHPLPANTVVRAMPDTAVGSANGMSMMASMNFLPGKSYRTSVQAMAKTKTMFTPAATSEAPNDNLYEASARGLAITLTKRSQSMPPALSTSAASGMSTMAQRKNVVNPSVMPTPAMTLGSRLAPPQNAR